MSKRSNSYDSDRDSKRMHLNIDLTTGDMPGVEALLRFSSDNNASLHDITRFQMEERQEEEDDYDDEEEEDEDEEDDDEPEIQGEVQGEIQRGPNLISTHTTEINAEVEQMLLDLHAKADRADTIEGMIDDEKERHADAMRNLKHEMANSNVLLNKTLEEMSKKMVLLIHPEGRFEYVMATGAESVELHLMIPEADFDIKDIRSSKESIEILLGSDITELPLSHASDVIARFWAKRSDLVKTRDVVSSEIAVNP